LHASAGFLPRIGQTGDAPGLAFTAKQSAHTVFFHVVFVADVAERGLAAA